MVGSARLRTEVGVLVHEWELELEGGICNITLLRRHQLSASDCWQL
jgi:hypothetical protein